MSQWLCARDRHLVENVWTEEAYQVLLAVCACGLKASNGLTIAVRSKLWGRARTHGKGCTACWCMIQAIAHSCALPHCHACILSNTRVEARFRVTCQP